MASSPMPKCSVILLLILLTGCESQLPAPTPAVEDPAARAKATLDAIETARQAAYGRYVDCRATAESNFNDGLATQGTPTPGKKGMYTERIPGAFEKLRQQQNFDDTECRKVYEAELGLIQPRLPQPEEPPK
jgi:hypothetical protein